MICKNAHPAHARSLCTPREVTLGLIASHMDDVFAVGSHKNLDPLGSPFAKLRISLLNCGFRAQFGQISGLNSVRIAERCLATADTRKKGHVSHIEFSDGWIDR